MLKDFKRAFIISLSGILLFLLLVFSFEFINQTVSESGFSSGEVLLFEFRENIFSGEILGKKFSADFSAITEFLPKLRFLQILIPPVIRLGIIILGAVF